MRYSKLAEFYEEASSTTKRLEKIDILSKFLKSLKKEDSDILYLIEGNIYPNYDERKTGISNQLAIKAITKATGTNSKKVVQKWKTIGDIGKVAEELTKHKEQATLHNNILTTEKVLENLRKLPELEGKGTVNKKLALITELLTSASPTEALYLVRTLIGDLRIGVQESTIKYGILKAFFKNNKEYESKIQRAIDNSNDLAVVFDITGDQDIECFVNGVSLGGAQATTNSVTTDSSASVLFGNYTTDFSSDYLMDGFLDETIYWNTARTQAQIQAEYNSGNGKIYVGDEAGMVGYWRYEDDLLDETSNDNDLTNNGSGTFSTDIPFVGGGSVNSNFLQFF